MKIMKNIESIEVFYVKNDTKAVANFFKTKSLPKNLEPKTAPKIHT